MLVKKATQQAQQQAQAAKMHITHNEEIRQSLDVLDRVLSEFDDIETDTNDDGQSVKDHTILNDEHDNGGDHQDDHDGPEHPPPIDRGLKPRVPEVTPPDLPKKTRSKETSRGPGSGSSSPSSHEYQEINSDMGLQRHPPDIPVPPPPHFGTPPDGHRGMRRQLSEDRASRQRRTEEDMSRRGPRRQRSEETRLRQDDLSSSSGELVNNLDVRENRPRGRESSRQRSQSRDSIHREPRMMRKSRSGDVESRREGVRGHQRRRSRSSDRWIEQQHLHQQEQMIDPRMMDPRLLDPRMIDPRMIDPRMIDPRMVDPRVMDPRYMDEPIPYPTQDPIRFPHLMGYPHLTQGGPMSPENMSPRGNLSPMPPNSMGPPFLPMDYPTYPMYPYDPYMGPDPILGPEMAFLPGGRHPPPEYLHHEYLHPDYPLEYPLDYGHGGQLPPGPHPGMMPGVWGPHGRHLDDWPPPSPDQAQQLINNVVRNPSRSSADDDEVALGKNLQPGVHPRNGHRLTSIGHSDSSGRSSPTESRRPIGRKSSGIREDFRVGDPVMERDHRGHIKPTTQLPHFSSGKDSGFEESPVVEENGTLSGRTGTAGRGGGGGGGGFIVSGVFNDSSKMYIPAPPSPTPDYDDDEDTDGNESDILHGSQFYVVGPEEYGNIPAHIKKKKLAARDSLSDDSLQGANLNKSKPVPIQKPGTPLQNMMHEFHQGLPPPDQDEIGFSDDSLEDLTNSSPSRPSTVSQKNIRQNSLESLASMESSTASFDYINAGQVRNSNFGKFRSRANSNGNNNIKSDKKDLNGKIKTSSPKTPESETFFISLDDNNVSPENGNKNSGGTYTRRGSKESPQRGDLKNIIRGDSFEKVRHMLKEGLIDGLDEKPPEFVPPPPLKRASNGNHSEDRADSGMGSTASTTRTDESGGSDNHSEPSGTPTSLVSPRSHDANRIPMERGRTKGTVRSISSMASEDMERNRDESEEVEVSVNQTIETPPVPPPREESLTRSSSRNLSSTPPVSNSRLSHTPKDSSNSRLQNTPVNSRLPSTPSSSRNSSWLHSRSNTKDEMLEVSSNRSLELNGDKITHVDDLYGRHTSQTKDAMGAINGSIASNYSNPDPDNPLTDREFLENLKNLEPRPRPDTLAVISEDQGSVGSRGSRTGRLLSRLSDSVRSGSRTPTPSSTSSSTKATTQKLVSTSRSSTRIHGDIIREPWRTSLRENALPSPQDFGRLPSLSPSAVPLSRDGSGRFRSIEDLAEQYNSTSLQQQEALLSSKKKKHSTLPPNLTPADMKKENKELRRATSLMCGKKGKGTSNDPALPSLPGSPQTSPETSPRSSPNTQRRDTSPSSHSREYWGSPNSSRPNSRASHGPNMRDSSPSSHGREQWTSGTSRNSSPIPNGKDHWSPEPSPELGRKEFEPISDKQYQSPLWSLPRTTPSSAELSPRSLPMSLPRSLPTCPPSPRLDTAQPRQIFRQTDEGESSKFRFNFFRGFWRRKQYSFDNKV